MRAGPLRAGPRRLIGAKLDRLFVGMVVESWAAFRVSRNGDLTVEEEEADDLLEAVEMELRPPSLQSGCASRSRLRHR